jgi:nucleoside-diphosphate-sugar epimerase
MINFSTSDVYGNAGGILRESDQPLYQNNRYGLTKYLAEQIVEYEAYNNGLKAVTLRPFMLYSENETKAHYRSAMIRFAMDLVEGKGVTVYEYTWRSWLHIDDAVVAFANAAELDCPYYDIINIGHSESISALDLVKRMLMILGKSEDLITEKKLPKTIAGYKRPGLEKQKGLLGFEPKVELQDGVERLIQNLLEAKNAAA